MRDRHDQDREAFEAGFDAAWGLLRVSATLFDDQLGDELRNVANSLASSRDEMLARWIARKADAPASGEYGGDAT